MRTNPLGFFIKCGFALQDTGIDVQIGWHVDNVWGYHEDFHFILVIARTFTSHLNDTLFEDNNDKGDWVVVSALIKILTTPSFLTKLLLLPLLSVGNLKNVVMPSILSDYNLQ